MGGQKIILGGHLPSLAPPLAPPLSVPDSSPVVSVSTRELEFVGEYSHTCSIEII